MSQESAPPSVRSAILREFRAVLHRVVPHIGREVSILITSSATLLRQSLQIGLIFLLSRLITGTFSVPQEALVETWADRVAVILIVSALLSDMYRAYWGRLS